MKNLTNFISKYLSLYFVLVLVPQTLVADTVCLKSTLTKKGKIKNKTVSVVGTSACPRGHVAILSSTALTTSTTDGSATIKGEQGPQGIQGAQGPQGIQGPQGAQGPQGIQGPSGMSGLILVSKTSDQVDSSSPKSATVECPVGTSVLSGYGGAYDGLGVVADLPVAISFSSILPLSRRFSVRAYETTAVSSSWFVMTFAYCRPNGS